MPVRPLIQDPRVFSRGTAQPIRFGSLSGSTFTPPNYAALGQKILDAFNREVVNNPTGSNDWKQYAGMSISDVYAAINQFKRGERGFTFTLSFPQKTIPGTNLTAGAALDGRKTVFDPSVGKYVPEYHVRYYIMAPDGSSGDVYTKVGKSLQSMIDTGDFTLLKGKKLTFVNAIKNLPHEVGHALSQAIQDPGFQKALLVTVAAPLAVEAGITSGVLTATGPGAYAPTSAAAAFTPPPVPFVGPPAPPIPPTVAPPPLPSAIPAITGGGGILQTIGQGTSDVLKTVTPLAPLVIGNQGGGGGGGGVIPPSVPAPTVTPGAPGAPLPKWTVPALIGGAALLLAYFNS